MDVLKKHIYDFAVMLAAFLTPVGWQIFAINFFVFGNYITVSLLNRKQKTSSAGNYKEFLIKAGIYVFMVLMFLVGETAFPIFKQWKIASVVSGFFAMRELKVVIENFSIYTGFDLLEEIKKFFKIIK